MDKTTTQTIELITNEITISFVSTKPSLRGITVTGYRMGDGGLYFVYDQVFFVNEELINEEAKRALFFVPYAHIVAIQTKIAEDVETVAKEQVMTDTIPSDQPIG